MCVGVPYDTSYWHAGDSSEQNACFRIALTMYKQDLLTRKESISGQFAIEKEDVHCLFSRAWQDSFAHTCTIKNVFANRGCWTPLNLKCLLHPEILATRWQGRVEREEHCNRCDDDKTDDIVEKTRNSINENNNSTRASEPLPRTSCRHAHRFHLQWFQAAFL